MFIYKSKDVPNIIEEIPAKTWGHPKKNFCFRSSGCPFLKPVGRPLFFSPSFFFSVEKYCPFLEKSYFFFAKMKKKFPIAPF